MSKDSSFKLGEIRVDNYGLFGLSIVVAVMIFFVSQIFPVLLTFLFLLISGKNEEEATALFADNITFQLVLYALVALTSIYMIRSYLKWRHEKPLKFLMIKPKPPTLSELWDIVITYGLYFVTLLTAVFLLSSTSAVDVTQAQELGINQPENLTAQITIFVMLVVIPPISEEILFRGFLFNKLKKYASYAVSAVIVSLLFGLAHLEYQNLNWIAVVDTLIFSFYLIYISQKHKSLYSSMILHAIKNLIAFYSLFIISGPFYGESYNDDLIRLAIAGFVFGLLYIKHNNKGA